MKMTPKEKAFELIDKYSLLVPIEFGGMDKNLAKQCALIAVDEIINSRKEHLVQSIKFYEYWTEVKKEVERL
jgi:hypothetical protein